MERKIGKKGKKKKVPIQRYVIERANTIPITKKYTQQQVDPFC